MDRRFLIADRPLFVRDIVPIADLMRTGVDRPRRRRAVRPPAYPATDVERRAHFRLSLGRSAGSMALAVAGLFLFAFWAAR